MKHYFKMIMIIAGVLAAPSLLAPSAEAAILPPPGVNSCPVHKFYVPACGKCQRNAAARSRSCPVHLYYVPACGKCQRNAAARGYRILPPKHHVRPLPPPPPKGKPAPPPHKGKPVPPPHRH